MSDRLDRSMELFSASWRLLRSDWSLTVYPFVSALSALVVAVSFAAPILAFFRHSETTTDFTGATQTTASLDPMGWVLAGIGYFVFIYVGIFCNAALIVAANEKLTGSGPGTLASGFSGAWSKAGAIVPWALLSATVTVILRHLEERAGIIGKIAIGVIGIAWTLVTYLVVPVLVLEDAPSTGKAISRSASLFKGTWGENVIGNVGFGVFHFFAALPAIALIVLGIASGVDSMLVMCLIVGVVWLIAVAQVIAALAGVYRVALFRYAVDGVSPAAFASFDFAAAFRPKTSSRLLGRSSTATSSGWPTTPNRRTPRRWQPPPVEHDPTLGAYGISIPGDGRESPDFGVPQTPSAPGAAAPGTPPASPPPGSNPPGWRGPGSSGPGAPPPGASPWGTSGR